MSNVFKNNTGPDDVDSYNVMVFPEDLLKRFGPTHSVALASHHVNLRDPACPNMMTIATSPEVWRIDQHYKVPLLTTLVGRTGFNLKASPFPYALNESQRMITLDELVWALEDIGCETVRFSTYGIKKNIKTFVDPASPDHPEAELNSYDLGVEWDPDSIFLTAPKRKLPKNVSTLYPMLGPRGLGYGSIKFKIQVEEDEFTIKIYPKLVHVLKSAMGKGILYAPKTMATLKKRQTNLEKLCTSLREGKPEATYGVRVECTVTASSFEEAKAKVSKLPLLSIKEYLKPVHPDFKDFKIGCHEVSHEVYMEQFTRLLKHVIETLKLFAGRSIVKTTPRQMQICLDMFNVAGWNPGRMRITSWVLRASWWRVNDQEDLESDDDSSDDYVGVDEVDVPDNDGDDITSGEVERNDHPVGQVLNLSPPRVPVPAVPAPPLTPVRRSSPASNSNRSHSTISNRSQSQVSTPSYKTKIYRLKKDGLRAIWDRYGHRLICNLIDCKAQTKCLRHNMRWDGDTKQFRLKCRLCLSRYGQASMKCMLMNNRSLRKNSFVVPSAYL
ncbi:unnamed protein product [Tilletia laevis]|uniref:Uncharacterized protein n=1 Tax=Tilletia laevis TaxID=157183 RepID=A0A9N8LZE5_9BASI|nr:unnamed protein product [Tilletia controversa]CAD6951162.1 unnamed protein product [Tilletia laevis]CAD6973767.1 unnamed protein product [Tilletia controversa]